MRILALWIFLSVVVQPTVACDLCAIYAANEARGEIGKGFFAGSAEQFTHFGTLQEDGCEVSDAANQFIDSSVTQILLGYNFNERAGVQFNLPFIHRSFQRPRGSVIERGTEAGIGDVSLAGNFVAYQELQDNFMLNWTLLGGIKFPTGDSSRLDEPDVDNVPPLPPSGIGGHDLALGSGSFDGVVGTGLSARWKKLFLTANLQYAIRTAGDFGHQYANDLIWSGGPGVYLALNHKYTLALQAVVSGETKDKDTVNGVPDGDSADTIVYLGPQINFTWSSKLSAQAAVDLPVSIENSGVQVVPDYRVRAGLTWRF